MSRSLIVTGSLELQADELADRIARRVVELLASAGSDVYQREPEPGPLPPRGTVRNNLDGEQP